MRKNKTLFEYSIELALAAYLHPQDKAEKQIKTMVRRFKKEVSADRVKVTKSFKMILDSKDPVHLIKRTYAELCV